MWIKAKFFASPRVKALVFLILADLFSSRTDLPLKVLPILLSTDVSTALCSIVRLISYTQPILQNGSQSLGLARNAALVN